MTEAVLDHSARVTRIPAPIASPGQCALCGKPDHPKGFAATDNFDFEFHGTIYFCYDCVGDYARVFGYVSSEEISALLIKQKEMHEELLVLRESVANLENILDAYAKLRPNSGLPDHSAISIAVASTHVDEGDTTDAGEQLQLGTSEQSPNDSVTDGSVGNGEGSDDDVNESSDEQRPDDLSSTSSNVTNLFTELGI